MNAQIEQAIESLKSGNRQDAERALEALQGVIYGFGMKVCGSPEDAQDTAQETLIRLARQLREFPDARALSVWLCKRIFAMLSDYLNTDLSVKNCRELERHLKGCGPCIAYLESLKITVEACRGYQVRKIPPPSRKVREALLKLRPPL